MIKLICVESIVSYCSLVPLAYHEVVTVYVCSESIYYINLQ